MKTVCIVTILFAATMGLDIRFILKPNQDNKFQLKAYDMKESSSTGGGFGFFISNPISYFSSSNEPSDLFFNVPLKFKKMGIPVIFTDLTGHCSGDIWTEFQSTSELESSMQTIFTMLKHDFCKKFNLHEHENPTDRQNLNDYDKVAWTSIQESPDNMSTIFSFTDMRQNKNELLVIHVDKSNFRRKLKAENRILKLSISPQGGAELEMGRGPVIV